MRSHRPALPTVTAGLALLGAVAAAGPVHAAPAQQPSASTTGTATVAVRSITLSPDAFAFGGCLLAGQATGATLNFPNGLCTSPPITVVNGDTPAHVHVRADDFLGAGDGPPWDLVTSGPPGRDEAMIERSYRHDGAVLNGGPIGNEFECDTAWNVTEAGSADGCLAEPGESIEFALVLTGPASTLNPSATFTSTVTWVATP